MGSVLHDICLQKRLHVEERKKKKTFEDLKNEISATPPPQGFIRRLKEKSKQSSPALITEVKKASPSKGIIRKDFDPAAIAKTYEMGGAACVSVLTDMPYFQGCDEDFLAVRNTTTLPLLRKDFMIDEYQIYESRAMGADCVLLIMAALPDEDAATLYRCAKSLGMDVLVEVHDREELERSFLLSPEMIGINNRNLKTLTVDINTSFDLAPLMPPDCLKVSESGISEHETLRKLQTSGFHAFLVGESLMRENDVGKALERISGNILTHKGN